MSEEEQVKGRIRILGAVDGKILITVDVAELLEVFEKKFGDNISRPAAATGHHGALGYSFAISKSALYMRHIKTSLCGRHIVTMSSWPAGTLTRCPSWGGGFSFCNNKDREWAFDFCFVIPTDDWRVEKTDGVIINGTIEDEYIL